MAMIDSKVAQEDTWEGLRGPTQSPASFIGPPMSRPFIFNSLFQFLLLDFKFYFTFGKHP